MKTLEQIMKDGMNQTFIPERVIYTMTENQILSMLIEASKQAFSCGFEIGYETHIYNPTKEINNYLKEIQ